MFRKKFLFKQNSLRNSIIYSYDVARFESNIENGMNYMENELFCIENTVINKKDFQELKDKNLSTFIYSNAVKDILNHINNKAKHKGLYLSALLNLENQLVNIYNKDKDIYIKDYREKNLGKIVLTNKENKVLYKDIIINPKEDIIKTISSGYEELFNKFENLAFVKNSNINDQSTVIFSPLAAGYLIHEILGHMLEGDSIKNNQSLFSNEKIGKRICNLNINIKDTPFSNINVGLSKYDDEGEELKDIHLVEDGILNGYILDKGLSKEFDMEFCSGCARTESYKHRPIPRMRTTYLENNSIEKGLEEIIINTEHGYYVSDIQFGRVDLNTGDYELLCGLVYVINDGKKVSKSDGVIIRGNALTTLSNIEELGSDLQFGIGQCIKAGQVISVGFGSPTIKVKNLRITGGDYAK